MKCTKLDAAIVLFGERATVEKHFSQKFSLSEFRSRLYGAAPLPFSRTMTHEGLRVTSEEVFPFSRKNASKIAILITDGMQTPPYSPFEAARKLKEQGVRLFAVGIGSSLKRYMARFAERGEDVIVMVDFYQLVKVPSENNLVRKVIAAVGMTIQLLLMFITHNKKH